MSLFTQHSVWKEFKPYFGIELVSIFATPKGFEFFESKALQKALENAEQKLNGTMPLSTSSDAAPTAGAGAGTGESPLPLDDALVKDMAFFLFLGTFNIKYNPEVFEPIKAKIQKLMVALCKKP